MLFVYVRAQIAPAAYLFARLPDCAAAAERIGD
jgi:hypothetical protein